MTMKNNFRTNRNLQANNSAGLIILILAVILILGSCSKKETTLVQPPPGATDSLRFVFLADSRGDTLQHPIHLEALVPIINQIAALNPKPSFVVYGGDMCYRGCINNVYLFDTFKHLFDTLTKQGIPLFTAIGNHELYHQHSSYGFLKTNQEAYQTTFSENPDNGPAGYKRLVYSFTDPVTSSFFVVLDPYYVYKDTVKMGLGGTIDTVQMDWLKTQVAGSSALHQFLFIHVPYYYVDSDPDELSSADTTLTKVWSFIDNNKFDMYLCGHSHLFARRTIVDTIHPSPQTTPATPAWQNNVVQLLNGTSGAGPSTGPIPAWVRDLYHVNNNAATYYFSVVDVYGRNVTVNSYGGYTGAYTLMDTFTITK